MPTTEGSSILYQIFGCCLGRKRGGTSRGDNGSARDRGGEDVNERTPLISGEADVTDSIAGGTGELDSNAQSGSKNDDKPAFFVKRSVDAARLKLIRDQANDAFFHIDNSQLLPSSSSRPVNSNSSQYGRGQRRDQAKENVRHQSLVAESDKAERLYKAAMVSPAHSEGRPFVIDGIDDNAEEAAKADKSKKQIEAPAIHQGSPLGLVRQMGVSIREATPNKKEAIKEQGSSALVRKLSSSPREGLPDAHERGNTSGTRRKMEHHPSLHSLRTLRLSVASNLSPSLSSEMENTDEEDWDQRGRTRSKRGLAWIDVGQSRDVTQKPKLDEMFKDVDDVKEGKEVQETKVITDSSGEEVPNALRLSAKQSEVTSKISDRLKALSPITAEMFEGNHDGT